MILKLILSLRLESCGKESKDLNDGRRIENIIESIIFHRESKTSTTIGCLSSLIILLVVEANES